tara:strand:- start:196 stop:468 length:273 start_codon:yes stop_codon:yes gene_type:complete
MKIFIPEADKNEKRATMVIAHTVLAIVQSLTIFVNQTEYNFNPLFKFLELATFFETDRFIFKELNFLFFERFFSFLIFVFGLILISTSFQ